MNRLLFKVLLLSLLTTNQTTALAKQSTTDVSATPRRRASWAQPRPRCIVLSTTSIRGGDIDNNNMASTAESGADTKNLFQFYMFQGGTCPYAARTWMVLLELGLPFEMIELADGKHKSEEFLAINPRGKVPALRELATDFCVYESRICNEYLVDYCNNDATAEHSTTAKNNAGLALMPLRASDRAKIRLLCDHFDAQVAPAQFTFFMNKETEKEEELKEQLDEALDFLEDSICTVKEEEGDSSYLAGSKVFSLADAHVLPFFLRMLVTLEHFKGYKLPTSRFGKLLKWYGRCRQRPSFRATALSKERIIELYQRFYDADYNFGGLNKN
jgi:glutathione S-transferase